MRVDDLAGVAFGVLMREMMLLFGGFEADLGLWGKRHFQKILCMSLSTIHKMKSLHISGLPMSFILDIPSHCDGTY